jgi:hypothetical protein
MQEKKEKESSEEISRREALEKLGLYGKYAAITAMSTYLILQPQKAIAISADPPGTGF